MQPYEIDKLVLAYQKTGNSLLAKRLLEQFKPFLLKYYKLLVTGKWKWNDKDIKQFLYLFKTDIFYSVKKDRFFYEPETVQWVRRFNFNLERLEIWNELQILLIELLKRWKPFRGKDDVHFAGYLYVSYKYMVKNWIAKRAKEILNRPDDISLCEEFGIESPVDMDKYWVHGITCNPIFEELTEKERQILKWNLYDHFNVKQIAKKLGCHRNTVHIIKTKALKKVKDEKLSLFQGMQEQSSM